MVIAFYRGLSLILDSYSENTTTMHTSAMRFESVSYKLVTAGL